MLSRKNVLWSVAAVVPLLGLGAWYAMPLGYCSPDCREAKASLSAASQPVSKVAAHCCPDGDCCPDCFPGCCLQCPPDCCAEGVKPQPVKAEVKPSSADDCCLGGNCCLGTKKAPPVWASEFVGPICPPCPFCP
jgi:hypothetical protein